MRKKMGLKFAEGGTTDAHVKKELSFMKNKGAPASMIAAEKKEHGIGKRRYATAGEVEGPSGMDIASTDIGGGMAPETPLPAVEQQAVREPAAAPAAMAQASFKDTFAAARAAGKPTFEWRGKVFTTDLAPAKAAAPKPHAQLDRVVMQGRSSAAGEGLRDRMEAAKAVEAKKAALRAGAVADATKKMKVRSPYMPAEVSNAIPGGVLPERGMATGGAVGFSKGGRIDGCAQRGKTRGTMR